MREEGKLHRNIGGESSWTVLNKNVVENVPPDSDHSDEQKIDIPRDITGIESLLKKIHDDYKKHSDSQREMEYSIKDITTHMIGLNQNVSKLTDTLNQGFGVVKTAGSLVRLMIFSLLFVIVILGSVIVYITKVDVNAFGVNLSKEAQTTRELLKQEIHKQNEIIVTLPEAIK